MTFRILSFFFVPLLLASGIQAQNLDLAKAYDAGVAALESGDLDNGLKIVDLVLEKEGASGKSVYGPAFGHFYYLRGMLLIKKDQLDDAISPLKTCYDEFSNEGRSNDQAPNLFREHALFQWGLILQSKQNYEEAAEKFRKTLEEDPRRNPPINRMAVEMNLAQCLIKLGKEDEGRSMLSKVLDLENLPDDAIQDAFTLLAAGGGMGGDATMNIVQQHAGSLFGSNQDLEVMNPRLASLAAKSLRDGNPLQALVWYNLLTPPHTVLDRHEVRKQVLTKRRDQADLQDQKELVERIDTAIEELDQKIKGLEDRHTNSLLGMAAAHYQVGSLSAALSLYRQLVDHFPEFGDPPQLMHNLIICSTQVSDWDTAFEYGNRFFADFPNHELKPAVSRLLAEVVFIRGDYELAYEMAVSARTGLSGNAPEREGLDFVAAATLYLLNRFAEAEPELENYVDQYPDSERLEPMLFYLASTKVKLSKWVSSIPLLDRFSETYRDSSFRPTALYLASLAYLIVEEPHNALIRTNTLLGDHPRAPQIPGAYNVKGDAQAAMEESYDTIVNSYKRARVEGQQAGMDDVAAYAVKQLIATAAEAKDHETAVAYFDEFQQSYADNIWNVDATLAAVDSLVALDRRDDARSLLEQLVIKHADQPGGEFDTMFQSYLRFLGNEYPIPEVISALDQFPNRGSSPALDGWLIMGQIEALQSEDTVDQAAVAERFSELNQLYRKNGNALSNYSLVQLAQHLGQQGKEADAVEIYDFIVSERPEGDALGYALIGTATLDFASGKPARLEAAKDKYSRVLSELDSQDLQEQATLGLARVFMQQGAFSEAQPLWETYLESKTWSRSRPESNFNYAVCLQEQGKRNEALKVYITVYANFPGHLDWSTEAYLRAANILWDTGRNLEALKMMQDMLRRMNGLEHPNIEKAKNTFFQWRNEYVAAQQQP